MKRMISFAVLVMALVGLLRPLPAGAGIHLSFVPQATTPEQLAVAIVISGMVAGAPPSLGAFDLGISFDAAVLTPTEVEFERFLGQAPLEALARFEFLETIVNLAEVSLLLPAELDALQPDTFPLATLVFDRITPGDDSLAFAHILLGDAFGNPLSVPEPPHNLLVAVGLAALGATLWRRPTRRTPAPLA